MFNNEHIELWNITPEKPILNGAQNIFNLVGRLKKAGQVSKLMYSLNGRKAIPVFFNATNRSSGRLERIGDFNIDTILSDDLKESNNLILEITYTDNTVVASEINFQKDTFFQQTPEYKLNLEGVENAEQVGQVIDGKWLVSKDEQGTPCLEIREDDTGLDRIILFGNHQWETAYEVSTKIRIKKWMRYPNNVGILFKWNPHLQGDGTSLPTQWSTGLAYFYSECPGLRMRFGVDVHLDENCRKVGDYILKEKMLSPWRRWVGRNINRLLRKKTIYTQIKPNVIYNFNAVIHPERYSLTVWEEGKKRPRPQISISNPPEKLKNGSVGIIAHRCALQVYDFSVAPV